MDNKEPVESENVLPDGRDPGQGELTDSDLEKVSGGKDESPPWFEIKAPPGQVVPIPYPNIGGSSSTGGTTSSSIPSSSGDDAGIMKGWISNRNLDANK